MEDEIICPICGKATDDCEYFRSIEEESNDLPNTSVLDLKVTVTADNLEETLARRTFDESGDYVVDNFSIDLREYYQSTTNKGIYPEIGRAHV